MANEEIELTEDELYFLRELTRDVKQKLLDFPQATDEHFELLDRLIDKLA